MLGAIVGLVGYSGIQTFRLNSAEKNVATANLQVESDKRKRAEQDAVRFDTARRDELKTFEKEKSHAAEQQTIVAGYEARILEAERTRAAAVAERNRVSRQYASVSTFTTRSDTETASNCPTLQRATDRLEKLGEVASECSRLLEEGKILLRERDNQVEYLKGLLVNDRTLLESEKP